MPLAVTQEDFLVFILDQTRSIVAESAGYWGIHFRHFEVIIEMTSLEISTIYGAQKRETLFS